MKLTTATVMVFAGLTAAVPLTITPDAAEDAAVILRRQVSSTATELENGACRRVTFIFARGSTEPGNLGYSAGPAVCNGLKSHYGSANVACQGVGGPYTADIASNGLPAGTSTAAIGEAVRLFNLANTKCPSTIITAGGYSQGAAVIHGAAKQLSAAVQAQTVGLVTFGDTRNAQDRGQIPPFPASKVKIICLAGDGVCTGTLQVTAAHLAYAPYYDDGYNFLISKIGS